MTTRGLRSNSTIGASHHRVSHFHLTKPKREFDRLGGHARPPPTRPRFRRRGRRHRPCGRNRAEHPAGYLQNAPGRRHGSGRAGPFPAGERRCRAAARARRRETGLELLRTGRPAVAEETVSNGPVKQVLLTAHRPVRIADRNLLLSSSADISEQKAVEDHLFRSAYYDELTGLPMRRVIEDRANSLLQSDEPHGRFALAFLDIDNFKYINDYYGHAIGDALLVEMAKRLGLDLRESDMLSRISGDEFMLLLNPIQSEGEVAEFIDFILQRMKAPFFIDDSEIFASTSIGVSLYPEHGCSYDVLRQNADIAMYRVKNSGRGAAAFFDASM